VKIQLSLLQRCGFSVSNCWFRKYTKLFYFRQQITLFYIILTYFFLCCNLILFMREDNEVTGYYKTIFVLAAYRII